MTLIKYNWERTAVWHAERTSGVFWVPVEQVYRTYRGVRLGDLSPVWPEDDLRTEALRCARFFVQTREKRGYELTHAPDDILLYGPYHHRDWAGAQQTGGVTVGRSEGDLANAELADFLLYCVFKTPQVHQIEDYDLVLAAAEERQREYDEMVEATNRKHEELEREFA